MDSVAAGEDWHSERVSWFKIHQSKRTRKAPDQAGAHFHLSEHEEISENHEKQEEGFLALWAIFS